MVPVCRAPADESSGGFAVFLLAVFLFGLAFGVALGLCLRGKAAAAEPEAEPAALVIADANTRRGGGDRQAENQTDQNEELLAEIRRLMQQWAREHDVGSQTSTSQSPPTNPDLPAVVHVTMSGECYHLHGQCPAVRRSRGARPYRACGICCEHNIG